MKSSKLLCGEVREPSFRRGQSRLDVNDEYMQLIYRHYLFRPHFNPTQYGLLNSVTYVSPHLGTGS